MSAPGSPEELMQRLAAGEIHALGALYERYGDTVDAVIAARLRNASQADVEDLTHEVFLAVVDAAGRYREEGNLRAWLCGIAVRKARDWQRKRGLRGRLIERFWPREAEGWSSGQESRLEVRRWLERALGSLSPREADVLVLHEVVGLTGEEIATAVGIRPNTVWVHLHRARKRLRDFGQRHPRSVPKP